MDTCNATEGHVIIFDPKPNTSWDEKIYHRVEQALGKNIGVWGM
jgi:hypothetical protein